VSSSDSPSETTTHAGNDSGRRKAGRELRGDLFRYLPSQVLPAVIAFITIPILTRLLSPAEFGDYRLILAAVGAFGAAGSWIASAVYRFFPGMERDERLPVFRGTINWLLASTCAVFVTVWLGGWWALGSSLGDIRSDLFLIGAGLMLVNTVWGIASSEVRAVREVNWYSVSVVLNKALTLGLGVSILIWTSLRVSGLIYGSIAASLVLLPLLYRVTRRRLPRASGWDRVLARRMFRYGLPIALLMVVEWALQLSDRFFIAALRSGAEVGLYSAAYGIAEQSMTAIVLMFHLPFSILAYRVFELDGSDAASGFVADSTRSYLLLAIPGGAGLSVLAGPIMTVMTDAPYRPASVIMPVVALALLLGGIQWWYTTGPTFSEKTGQILISMSAAVVVNAGLNFLLIGRYGYKAAAVTSLIGYAVALIVMVWLSRRDFRWAFPFASAGRSLIAAGLMSGVIWVLNQATKMPAPAALTVSILLGMLVYGMALLALREPQAVSLKRRLFNRG
jgi:O-antigen/teichoic acid export membrane protein